MVTEKALHAAVARLVKATQFSPKGDTEEARETRKYMGQVLAEVCRNDADLSEVLSLVIEQNKDWPAEKSVREIAQSVRSRMPLYTREHDCKACGDTGFVGGLGAVRFCGCEVGRGVELKDPGYCDRENGDPLFAKLGALSGGEKS